MQHVRRGQKRNTNFRKVKDMTLHVYDKEIDKFVDVKHALLLDHRGETELLMRIPEWLALQQGLEPEPDQPEKVYYVHGRFMHSWKDSNDNERQMQKVLNAEELKERVQKMYRDYYEITRQMDKRKVIDVTYAVDYHYDDADGERHQLDSTGRNYGSCFDNWQVKVAMKMHAYYLLMNGDLYDFEDCWKDSFDKSNGKEEHLSYHIHTSPKDRLKLIPYTEDLWNKLERLKIALCDIGDKLHLLLNRPGDELAQMIESGLLKLPMIEDQSVPLDKCDAVGCGLPKKAHDLDAVPVLTHRFTSVRFTSIPKDGVTHE